MERTVEEDRKFAGKIQKTSAGLIKGENNAGWRRFSDALCYGGSEEDLVSE